MASKVLPKEGRIPRKKEIDGQNLGVKAGKRRRLFKTEEASEIGMSVGERQFLQLKKNRYPNPKSEAAGSLRK